MLVLLIAGSVVLYVKLAPVPAPLSLPPASATSPSGPVEGAWNASTGSQAGFRIRQTVLFAGNDVVERTTRVHGSLTISGDRITAATF